MKSLDKEALRLRRAQERLDERALRRRKAARAMVLRECAKFDRGLAKLWDRHRRAVSKIATDAGIAVHWPTASFHPAELRYVSGKGWYGRLTSGDGVPIGEADLRIQRAFDAFMMRDERYPPHRWFAITDEGEVIG